MKVSIRHPATQSHSYRVARTQSLFNVPGDHSFSIDADLDIEFDWNIGLIVGSSGSGKTSLGRSVFGADRLYENPAWDTEQPIIDALAPNLPYETVTQVLGSVGLNTIPAWLRSYQHLSTGEKFRADLARICLEQPEQVVIDEFTSTVDRQVAKITASAFAKTWRKTGKQAVLLSCHNDIEEWLQPDWVFNADTKQFARRSLRPRPQIQLDISKTDQSTWRRFSQHHYLDLNRLVAADYYVGCVDDTEVVHMAVAPRPGLTECRICRIVVMPDWQGIGVGLKSIEAVCRQWRIGNNRYNKPMPTLLHTSHPGLISAVSRSDKWIALSKSTHGVNKQKNLVSFNKSSKTGKSKAGAAHGGHLRGVIGFRYLGSQADRDLYYGRT